MRLLIFLASRARGPVLLGAFLGVIAGLCGAGIVGVIQAALQPDAPRERLVTVFVVLCLAVLATRFLSQMVLLRQAQAAVFSLRISLSRQIAATPLRTIERIGAARILNVLSEDLAVINLAMPQLLSFLPQMAVVAGCLVYMAWQSTLLLFLSVLMMAFGVMIYLILERFALKKLRLARVGLDSLAEHFRGLIEGVKELKLHSTRREIFLGSILTATSDSVCQNTIAGETIYMLAQNWGQTILLACVGMFLFIVPHALGVSTVIISSFTIATLYLARPLEFVLGVLPTLARAGLALRQVEALGLTVRDHLEIQAGTEWDTPIDTIQLSAVRYTYDDAQDGKAFGIGPLDLTLRRSEIVFVIGGNGSGKTTFAKVLTGLYPVSEGRISVNGQHITQHDMESYRQLFSAVYSDSYLFDSMVGLLDVDAIASALLVRLQLDRKVAIKDGRFSTTALSRGQRKRLMLLTALLEDRQIYIFDEWAADQDPLFREVFYTEIVPSLKARSKSVIVISHDERYFHLADRVLTLEYGRIVGKDSSPSRNGTMQAEYVP